MIEQLVVNGCSYMEEYAKGLGHQDLAKQLQIPRAHAVARAGSSNSRIIRTTLKHSYQTDLPTFYLIGITFLCRWELPVNETPNDFEGRWIPARQKRSFAKGLNFQFNWTDQDSDTFNELNFKSATFGTVDLLEDLVLRLLSMVADLRSRGHRTLIYAQSDDSVLEFLNQDRFELLRQDMSFVHGLGWLAVPWQLDQGVPTVEQNLGPGEQIDLPPRKYHHPSKGHHGCLNTFLCDYINKHHILK
jgi:hypothetical protein